MHPVCPQSVAEEFLEEIHKQSETGLQDQTMMLQSELAVTMSEPYATMLTCGQWLFSE